MPMERKAVARLQQLQPESCDEWDTTATSWSGCSTAQPATGDCVLQPFMGCDALVLSLLC